MQELDIWIEIFAAVTLMGMVIRLLALFLQ